MLPLRGEAVDLAELPFGQKGQSSRQVGGRDVLVEHLLFGIFCDLEAVLLLLGGDLFVERGFGHGVAYGELGHPGLHHGLYVLFHRDAPPIFLQYTTGKGKCKEGKACDFVT